MTLNNNRYRSIFATEELYSRCKTIRHVALDMDGTIYMGGTLFPYTLSFLQRMRQLGIGYSFLTNNPSYSTTEYLQKLARLGIKASCEEIYTTVRATIDYLRVHHPQARKLFLLGTPGMVEEFEAAGFLSTADDPQERPDVVIASFDKTLTYKRLCRAAWWIAQGVPYLATNPDRVCPTDEQTILVDCGSICKCLEEATARRPDVVLGKPDPNMLAGIIQRHGLHPEQIAMVGDRIYTDVTMAHNAGAMGVLVLSGETTDEMALAATPQPTITTQTLADFGELLAWSRTC